MKRLLTARAVAAFTKPGRYAVGHGCYLQISQWRTKAWVFRYVRGGKAHHVGMGRYDYVTLKQDINSYSPAAATRWKRSAARSESRRLRRCVPKHSRR